MHLYLHHTTNCSPDILYLLQYVQTLEARLKEAALKNSALLQENASLRKQMTALEKEVSYLGTVGLMHSSSRVHNAVHVSIISYIYRMKFFVAVLVVHPALSLRSGHLPLC